MNCYFYRERDHHGFWVELNQDDLVIALEFYSSAGYILADKS